MDFELCHCQQIGRTTPAGIFWTRVPFSAVDFVVWNGYGSRSISTPSLSLRVDWSSHGLVRCFVLICLTTCRSASELSNNLENSRAIFSFKLLQRRPRHGRRQNRLARRGEVEWSCGTTRPRAALTRYAAHTQHISDALPHPRARRSYEGGKGLTGHSFRDLHPIAVAHTLEAWYKVACNDDFCTLIIRSEQGLVEG